MSRGLNKVMIIGYLGRDPEMRYTPSGRPVTSFSIGTTRSWNTPEASAARKRSGSTSWRGVTWPKSASST